jgi:hypothetical protein
MLSTFRACSNVVFTLAQPTQAIAVNVTPTRTSKTTSVPREPKIFARSTSEPSQPGCKVVIVTLFPQPGFPLAAALFVVGVDAAAGVGGVGVAHFRLHKNGRETAVERLTWDRRVVYSKLGFQIIFAG